MKRKTSASGCAALIVSIAAVFALATGSASANVTAGAVSKTFSFIGKPNSSTTTLVNVDSLLINARCDATGKPVIFAFTSASSADLFGRIFDGLGRLHIVKNSAFTKTSKGVQLSTTAAISMERGSCSSKRRPGRS